MIDKKALYEVVESGIKDTGCFLVDITVSPANEIVVEIDSADGVDIDRCVQLTRLIESNFDREVEDYELEVGSAGLTSPFKVLGQYLKNIGNPVEVLKAEGVKLKGVLKAADDKQITLTIKKKVKPEGAKRPIEVEEDLLIAIDEIKYTKYLIEFK